MVVGWGNVTTVRLIRDSASRPWGFRLHGGQETQTPLSIQRVFVGGVSDGQLQQGDIVIGIEGCDTSGIYHSQAEEIIKGAGRQLTLIVRRDDAQRQNGIQSPQNRIQSPPTQWSAGSSQYSGSEQWNPHEFVNEPGRSRLGANDQDEDYTKRVGDIKKVFSRHPNQYPSHRNVSRSSSSPGTKKPVFRKPPSVGLEMIEPGWVPKNKPSPFSQNRYTPSVMRSPPVNRRNPPNEFHQSQQPHTASHAPPAWAGTLRSAGGPRAWEIQEQESLVGSSQPTQSPRHTGTSRPHMEGGGSPVVAHNPKVQTVRITGGGANPSTNQPVQSDVQRMILEEESASRGRGGRSASQPASSRRATNQRPAPPPQAEGEEPRSARFHQLVNENSDQMAEYMSTAQHVTAYPGRLGGGEGIEVRHGGAGISDF